MNARDSRGRRLAQALPVLRLAAAIGAVTAASAACGGGSTSSELDAALLFQGQKILRFDTFGDESRWTTKLQHEVVGTEPSPAQALSVGLKVDSEPSPEAVVQGIKDGSVDLTLPATSVALRPTLDFIMPRKTGLFSAPSRAANSVMYSPWRDIGNASGSRRMIRSTNE